jgi:thermitase
MSKMRSKNNVKIIKMRKSSIIVILMILGNILNAQNSGEWYKNNLESGTFGIELQKAMEFLKSKPVKRSPIVALIGTGADIEHEALKNSIWTNPKERADGIDNDNNGYVDDINGWNFIGSKDGNVMEFTMQEGDREWFRLKDKYADLIFDGKNYLKFVNGEKSVVPDISDRKEYEYFKNLMSSRESLLAGKYAGYIVTFLTKEYVERWDAELKIKFPDKARNEITSEEFIKAVYNKQTSPKDSLRDLCLSFVVLYSGVIKSYSKDRTAPVTWETIYDNYVNKQIEFSRKSFEQDMKKWGRDTRKQIVGDNYLDINDKNYGNNIAPDSKLMNLVVSAQAGEPYLKDIALSIRYAVENGADIIILPQQNSLYPPDQKRWVAEAINYAQTKGALVIVSVWEKSEDLAIKEYYPSAKMDPSFILNNLITVANSDAKGLPAHSSNYGANKLDIYAPGINIYSTSPGDLYKSGTSSVFGAAVTAGVAALIKSYYPNMTGVELRRVIVENPTSRKGVEIEKGMLAAGKPSQDLFLFEQLCRSAGIINVNNAVRAADIAK